MKYLSIYIVWVLTLLFCSTATNYAYTLRDDKIRDNTNIRLYNVQIWDRIILQYFTLFYFESLQTGYKEKQYHLLIQFYSFRLRFF